MLLASKWQGQLPISSCKAFCSSTSGVSNRVRPVEGASNSPPGCRNSLGQTRWSESFWDFRRAEVGLGCLVHIAFRTVALR